MRAWGFDSPSAHVVELEEMVVEVQVRFDAPPAEVFALLHDVERMAGLGPEHHTATWQGPTTFTGENRIGELGWTVRCHVVVDEPPTAFGWTVGDPEAPSSTWTYRIEPDGTGSLVTQRMQHGPGFSYLRQRVESDPGTAPAAIAWRTDDLRTSMTAVLQAAARLLSEH